jgi:hypothetical protein
MKENNDIWTALFCGIIIFLFVISFTSTDRHEKKLDNANIISYGEVKFIRVEPGTFSIGKINGEYDEVPGHKVSIKQPFYKNFARVFGIHLN